jgi:DnaJ-class molecular chaperone
MFSSQQLLNINNNSSVEEIKNNYKKILLLIHPDKNKDNSIANHLCQIINKAYEEVLNNITEHTQESNYNELLNKYNDLIKEYNKQGASEHFMDMHIKSIKENNNRWTKIYNDLMDRYIKSIKEIGELNKNSKTYNDFIDAISKVE